MYFSSKSKMEIRAFGLSEAVKLVSDADVDKVLSCAKRFCDFIIGSNEIPEFHDDTKQLIEVMAAICPDSKKVNAESDENKQSPEEPKLS